MEQYVFDPDGYISRELKRQYISYLPNCYHHVTQQLFSQTLLGLVILSYY